ncbi:MAG: hypothetical protein ACREJ4_02575 [Candidatus Methylomirabilaceae bacterium]
MITLAQLDADERRWAEVEAEINKSPDKIVMPVLGLWDLVQALRQRDEALRTFLKTLALVVVLGWLVAGALVLLVGP